MSRASSPVEITALLLYEGGTGYKISETEYGPEVWLPRKFVEEARDTKKREGGHAIYEFTIPEWLAQDRGLV